MVESVMQFDGFFVVDKKQYFFRIKIDNGSFHSYHNGDKNYRLVEIFDINHNNIALITVFCGDNPAVNPYNVSKAYTEYLNNH